MMKELIITEKPTSALKISQALSEDKVETKKINGVVCYHIRRKNKQIIVVPAVGHLFTVAEKKKSFKYPVFDIQWKPVYEENKNSKFAKAYSEAIKSSAASCSSFVVACDYDIEGEVIGLNVIRFLCNQKDAKRMKFSTLTKPDLLEAYENISPTLDWGQAIAGETRHFLDWMYGINLSRALTLSIRKQKAYRTMSTGRVQGPALKILADREREIMSFVPKKFWEVVLLSGKIQAFHIKEKFWDEKEAGLVLKKTKGHDGFVKDISFNKQKVKPPYPFDLTTLQTEAYSLLGLTPAKTLSIAQDLYTMGYISYPRTSSQQISPKIGFKNILTNLSKRYKIAETLLSKQLTPNNGSKTDPAHPAIYPTGIIPDKLSPQHEKVYDLIVKRFLATFGEEATRETMTLKIDVNSEIFVAKGSRTVEQGWFLLYAPYVKMKEEEFPKIEKNQKLKVDKIKKIEKETQPPKRYTQASIIKELESRNLGTKATRAQIIENLYEREYLTGKSIMVTKLGMKTIETLEKYCPEIIDEELTRTFEEDMEKIREGNGKQEEILERAKKYLTLILKKFKENENAIGESLAKSYLETENEKSYISKCPVCKKGELHIKHSKKNNSRFIACSRYPECKAIFSVPREVKRTDQICEKCSHPIIEVRKGRIPVKLCINPRCPTKMPDTKEARKEEKEIEKKIVEQECPKCKSPLVIRKSMYGHFLGCSNFPKCRYTQPIKDGPLKEDFK